MRTADCVVGGFRYASAGQAVDSLLLGLYDDGLLYLVGFTSTFSQQEKLNLLQIVEPLIEPLGFTGNPPGGPSRWSTNHSAEWQPLKPKLVEEVQYDHFSGNRFRHGKSFLHWRPDKSPEACSIDRSNLRFGIEAETLEEFSIRQIPDRGR